MNEIDINKHTKYTLELIFSEADKMANQLLKSLSENVNKSFVLFAVFSSIFSFSFVKVVETNWFYSFLLIGSVISCFIIHKNLFPFKVYFNGSLPEKMIDSYFEKFQNEELEKEYLATQIQSYNFAMNENHKSIKNMVERFNHSIWCILISFILFGITFLISFVESSCA